LNILIILGEERKLWNTSTVLEIFLLVISGTALSKPHMYVHHFDFRTSGSNPFPLLYVWVFVRCLLSHVLGGGLSHCEMSPKQKKQNKQQTPWL
jgi:hypothetical protein